jgi:UDP:flavonoid glycosyltransferase YjiC (YdhE family)
VQAPDPEADVRQLAEGFARRGARRHAAAVLELARAWQPDVLVRDEVDFGTAIAAESLALPCATVLVLAAGGFLRKEVVAEPLHELRSAYGLPPDPELAMLDRHLVLSPFPPSFRNPRFPLPAHTFSFRQAAATPARATPRTPAVYFTLGTVDNTTDLFSRVLAGLQELPVNVVVTVGEHVDPAELGPLPDHIRVEQFVPQELLLRGAIWSFRTAAPAASWERSPTDCRRSCFPWVRTSRTTRGGASNSGSPGSWTPSPSPRRKCA